MVSKHTFFGGCRRTVRRTEDKRRHAVVDHYSPRLLITLLFIFILNFIDGYLTLRLLQENVIIEANPIMAFYLRYGDLHFISVKFFITSAALIIFCLCKHCSITKVLLISAVLMYLGLILYELSILHRINPLFS